MTEQNIKIQGGDAALKRFNEANLSKGKTPSYGSIIGQPADLTNRTFARSQAGAEATEKRRNNVGITKGGRGKNNTMFTEQAAESAVDNGAAGHTADPSAKDVAPGRKFAEGGGTTPGRSAASTAVPTTPGRTGNPRTPTGKKSVTRDYDKGRGK